MADLSTLTQFVTINKLICSSVLDFVYVHVHTYGFVGGRSLQPLRYGFAKAYRFAKTLIFMNRSAILITDGGLTTHFGTNHKWRG
jgi:hypothetical protein